MELKEFVSESLLQIFEGIFEAQKDVTTKYSGYINPVDDSKFTEFERSYLSTHLSQIHTITFNVAIQVSEKENAQAGLTVFSGIFGLGAKAGIEYKDATISRIQFEIPVKFPIQVTNRYFKK